MHRKAQRESYSFVCLYTQWDFSIAVKESQRGSRPIKPQGIEFDDDDDDDDDSDDGNGDDTEYFDCIGLLTGDKGKLKQNNLIHFESSIDRQEESKGEVRNVTRIFTDAFKEFKKKMEKEDNEINKSYPRSYRFNAFLDRRTQITTYSGKPPDIKTKTQQRSEQEKDEIIFYTPPKNARNIPNDHVPEIYFNHSKQVIIPNYDYIDEKIDPNDGGAKQIKDKHNVDLDKKDDYLKHVKILSHVSTSESWTSALLTFSFQVEQDDQIKCYLWYQGRCIRFLPSDVVDILPKLFDPDAYNNKNWNHNNLDAQLLITSTQFKDVQFNSWFQKMSLLDNPKQNLKKYILSRKELQNIDKEGGDYKPMI